MKGWGAERKVSDEEFERNHSTVLVAVSHIGGKKNKQLQPIRNAQNQIPR